MTPCRFVARSLRPPSVTFASGARGHHRRRRGSRSHQQHAFDTAPGEQRLKPARDALTALAGWGPAADHLSSAAKTAHSGFESNRPFLRVQQGLHILTSVSPGRSSSSTLAFNQVASQQAHHACRASRRGAGADTAGRSLSFAGAPRFRKCCQEAAKTVARLLGSQAVVQVQAAIQMQAVIQAPIRSCVTL